MTKASSLLAVLCGLASLSASLADPSVYGAAPAAKYPAPAATYPAPAATYPAPAATYPAPAAYPAPAKYETPAPTTTTPKYETPTTTTPKYEAPAKYEEKKAEYPASPMKMQYGGKKYRRSTEEDAAEEAKTEVTEDSEKMEDPAGKLPRKVVQTVRDAVIQDLLSMMDDDLDLDELTNFANDGEEEADEQQMNEDDEETFVLPPEMDTPMDDDMDDDMDSAKADPWITKNYRFLLRKRIQSKTMCRRYPYKCAGRPRPWLIRPRTVKRRRLVYRPTVRPMLTRFPSVMCGRSGGRCFWIRICC